MEKLISVILVFSYLAFFGCKDKSTDVKEDNTPRLILSTDKTSGQAPLIVNFTGDFQGKIDTIKMLVPDYVLFPGTGKTIILYALPDTTQPARQKYTTEYSYGAGTYKAVMLLQSKYKIYYSDTLTITVN